jgi:hypothetical protein
VSAPRSLKSLCMMTAALLLTGGILLDMDRINAVRDALDSVARAAASEAVAAARPAERKQMCQRRFEKGIWTDAEVSLDDVDVSVTENSKGRTAVVVYDVTVNLVVGRFFGFNEVVISGEAEADAPAAPVATASLP